LSGHAWKPPATLTLLLRFGSVGMLSTLVYVLVANLLTWLTSMGSAEASVAGYLAGMAVSFTGQSRFTFGLRETGAIHLLRFCLLSALGLAISYWCVRLATDLLGIAPVWGTLGTAILVPLVSFIAMKFWVFTPQPRAAESDGLPLAPPHCARKD
jgi:putative flippase GtrA